jgi:hypothetical protein
MRAATVKRYGSRWSSAPPLPDFAALDVISELLFSQAAPLYQQVVVREQWADFIGAAPA